MSLASLPTIDSVTFARVRLGPDNLTELPLILIRRVDLNILCKFCSIMSHHVFTMFSPHVHCNFCWFLKVLFLIWLWLKMTPKMDGQILDISKNNQFCGSVGHWYHNLEPYIAILCHTVPGPYMVIPMFPHVPWQSSTLGLPDPVAKSAPPRPKRPEWRPARAWVWAMAGPRDGATGWDRVGSKWHRQL